MSHQSNTQVIKDLAERLQVSQEELTQAIQESQSEDGYVHYEIPKGNGKTRSIHAPADTLKMVQKSILNHLLHRVALSPFAHGFAPGKSIITNAKVHVNTAKSILSVDLLDAFPSVKAERVEKLFQWRLGPLFKIDLPQYKSEQYHFIYQTLTQLCTRDGQLPQGAPTSGYLLNLACTRLDKKIFNLAIQSGLAQIRYSRYADDLTITSSAHIPSEFKQSVLHLIVRSGFQANYHKIEHYDESQKALVICGIRLHQGQLALPRKRLHEYRALFDHALSLDAHEMSLQDKQKIMGSIAFLRSIYPACPSNLTKPLNRLLHMHASWIRLPKVKDDKISYRHFTYQNLEGH